MPKISICEPPHHRQLLVGDPLTAERADGLSIALEVAKGPIRNRGLVIEIKSILPQPRRVPQVRQFPRSIASVALSASTFYSMVLVRFLFGERLAVHCGMLRINLPTATRPGLFVLEGKLSGLWAAELVRVARQRKDVRGSIFDLEAVFPVDSAGEEALRKLNGFGARFTAESVYGKDLCKRLKLHRVGASKGENHKRRPVGSLANANDERGHVAELASFANAAAGQHCSRRGE